MIEKYRVHEVAKDLNIPSKDIIALLEEHFPGEPKKHMTALTDAELNLVFDKFTRERSLPKLDSYFALQSEKPKAPAAPKPPREEISGQTIIESLERQLEALNKKQDPSGPAKGEGPANE